jgi:hypothetical protein
MNILLSIALTTGILSGLWGWVAVSLGLIGWAGFLAVPPTLPVRKVALKAC